MDPLHIPVESTTLENGLRVVVIRDPLVPVATIEENYVVGADETPPETTGNIRAVSRLA